MAEAEAVSKITQLLNECQLSQAVHGRAAKALVDIRRNHPAAFASTLTACLQHVLLTPKVGACRFWKQANVEWVNSMARVRSHH